MIETMKKNLLFTLQSPEFCTDTDSCRKILDQLNDSGFWPDLAYDEPDPNGWSFTAHATRLANCAANREIIEDPVYFGKLNHGLNAFLAEHRHNPNWWHNEIGLPMWCGRILLCLEKHLTKEQVDGLMPYLKQGAMTLHENFFRLWFGANLLWGVYNTLLYALAICDLSGLEPVLDAAAKELTIRAPGSQGIQPDFSFVQHKTQFYSGGYGRSFMAQFSDLIYILKGSSLQFSAEELGVMANFMIHGQRWLTRLRGLDYLTVGRELSRPDALNADPVFRKALYLLVRVEEMPCRDVMQEQLAALCAESYGVQGTRFFEQVNYFVQHTAGGHIGCRGTSPLLYLGESINGENHLSANEYAGGATCIMVTGKEYLDIFPLWDFAHVPGTTAPAENDAELEAKLPYWHGTVGTNRYCGGVARDNMGILFQDLNFDGVTGVTAKFFIDGRMFALGADLRCEKEKPLHTTLNQCFYDGNLQNTENGLIHGKVAYISLDGQKIRSQVEEKSVPWSRINRLNTETAQGTVCTLWLDHGIMPEGAGYAYGVMPGVSPVDATAQITRLGDSVTVLQNSKTIQAILYKDVLMAVFHESGTLYYGNGQKISASGPSAHILSLK